MWVVDVVFLFVCLGANNRLPRPRMERRAATMATFRRSRGLESYFAPQKTAAAICVWLQ
jgi:hypothetical protein